MSKNLAANIIGILDISDGKMLVEVENKDESVNLSEYFSEFDGKEVSISINHKFDV